VAVSASKDEIAASSISLRKYGYFFCALYRYRGSRASRALTDVECEKPFAAALHDRTEVPARSRFGRDRELLAYHYREAGVIEKAANLWSSGPPVIGGTHATVRISERDLLIGRCQQQLLHHRQALHLAFQPDQFLLQMDRL
jgi:hypothetical protein